MPNKTRQELQNRSWIAVVRAYQTCSRRYSTLLEHYDLTVPQYDVLTAVRQLGGEATPKRIASRLLVTKGNITRILQRMKERGLLATAENKNDARSLICSLTPAGSEVLARAQKAASLFIDQQLSPFDDDALEQIQEQMEQMRHHLESMQIEPILTLAQSKE